MLENDIWQILFSNFMDPTMSQSKAKYTKHIFTNSENTVDLKMLINTVFIILMFWNILYVLLGWVPIYTFRSTYNDYFLFYFKSNLFIKMKT